MSSGSNHYVYQTEIRLTAAFSVGGIATDPTTVTLTIKKPNGNSASFTYDADIVKDSTGNYHYDYMPPTIGADADAIGWYTWRWDGTGAVKAADEGKFRVVASEVI